MPLAARIGVLVVPVLLIAIGVWMAVETWAFVRGSARTTAEIVSVRIETGTSRDIDGFSRTTHTYWPTVRFVAAGGTGILVETSQPASGFVPETGQVIPVRYFVDDPSWARPAFSWWTLWQGPVIFCGIGLFLVAALTLVVRLIARADRSIAARRAS